MGKELELLQAVCDRDWAVLQKIATKLKSKTSKKSLRLSRKSTLNARDDKGLSPIHHAVRQGNQDVLKLLIECGSDVDVLDNNGFKPLHYAAYQGDKDCVMLLLRAGSMPNGPAFNGQTPLHLACAFAHLQVVTILLRHRADPMLADKAGKTPFDLACESAVFQVVERILQLHSPERILSASSASGAVLEQHTCLHLAVRQGHANIVRYLLNSGASVNWCTKGGSALHEAVAIGRLDLALLLLEYGIDVGLVNEHGYTAEALALHTVTLSAEHGRVYRLLKDTNCAFTARALAAYQPQTEPNGLPLTDQSILTVIEQRPDGIWRGFLRETNPNGGADAGDFAETIHVGYFPASLVEPLPLAGRIEARVHRIADSSAAVNNQLDAPLASPASTPGALDTSRASSIGTDGASSSSSTLSFDGSGDVDLPVTPPAGNSGSAVEPTPPLDSRHAVVPSPTLRRRRPAAGQLPPAPVAMAMPPMMASPRSTTSAMLHTGQAPIRLQPVPAMADRNSSDSLDSGRGGSSSSSHHDYGRHSFVTTNSMDASSPVRSPLSFTAAQSPPPTTPWTNGALSVYASPMAPASIQPDSEQESAVCIWLKQLGLDCYASNFIEHGYELSTIKRMTPEDLRAIGINKPGVRAALRQAMELLCVADTLPLEYPRSVLEWLHLLGLDEYSSILQVQYSSIDELLQATWEDLDEAGIKKLGHLKKMMLAAERLKRCSRRPPSAALNSQNPPMPPNSFMRTVDAFSVSPSPTAATPSASPGIRMSTFMSLPTGIRPPSSGSLGPAVARPTNTMLVEAEVNSSGNAEAEAFPSPPLPMSPVAVEAPAAQATGAPATERTDQQHLPPPPSEPAPSPSASRVCAKIVATTRRHDGEIPGQVIVYDRPAPVVARDLTNNGNPAVIYDQPHRSPTLGPSPYYNQYATIRRRRNNALVSETAPIYDDVKLVNSMDLMSRSPPTVAANFRVVANGQTSVGRSPLNSCSSTSSIDSCSTLPFANDNAGTIRSKAAAASSIVSSTANGQAAFFINCSPSTPPRRHLLSTVASERYAAGSVGRAGSVPLSASRQQTAPLHSGLTRLDSPQNVAADANDTDTDSGETNTIRRRQPPVQPQPSTSSTTSDAQPTECSPQHSRTAFPTLNPSCTKNAGGVSQVGLKSLNNGGSVVNAVGDLGSFDTVCDMLQDLSKELDTMLSVGDDQIHPV